MKDEIVYILDRSGSMMGIIDDAIGGFNANLREQKQFGDANVTVVMFDNNYEILHDRVPIADVPEMDRSTYVPGGSTALLDAIGKTISTLKTVLGSDCAQCGPRKVSVVIITDGFENASREFSRGVIKEMIEHQQKAHDWQILFIASNQDAVTEGGKIGVQANSAVSFQSTGAGVRGAYSKGSKHLLRYRSKAK